MTPFPSAHHDTLDGRRHDTRRAQGRLLLRMTTCEAFCRAVAGFDMVRYFTICVTWAVPVAPPAVAVTLKTHVVAYCRFPRTT